MKKYKVDVSLDAHYEFEASSEEEARIIALDWFIECEPNFEIEEGENEND